MKGFALVVIRPDALCDHEFRRLLEMEKNITETSETIKVEKMLYRKLLREAFTCSKRPEPSYTLLYIAFFPLLTWKWMALRAKVSHELNFVNIVLMSLHKGVETLVGTVEQYCFCTRLKGQNVQWQRRIVLKQRHERHFHCWDCGDSVVDTWQKKTIIFFSSALFRSLDCSICRNFDLSFGRDASIVRKVYT